jgi:GNAT superfamily N-acetyltransferase
MDQPHTAAAQAVDEGMWLLFADRARVRPATPDDRDGLAAFVDRCSAETLYRRFHGAAGTGLLRHELDRVAHPNRAHRSWVAVSCFGQIRGTATLAWGRTGTVEAAFLVEDAWARRGVGRLLWAAVAAEARRAGLTTVLATVQADNDRAVRFLRGVAPGARSRFVGGAEVEVTIPIDPIDQTAAQIMEAA